MKNKIDWEKLAIKVGAIQGGNESGSGIFACKAIEELIGVQNIRDAVDYYINGGAGSELARYVIWNIHPWSAMEYCYEIYKSNTEIERKILAVELLRVAADERAIPWIKEFLLDSTSQIRGWGFGIVDQLLWSKLVDEDDMSELLELAESIDDDYLIDRVEYVRGYLKLRKRNEKAIQELPEFKP